MGKVSKAYSFEQHRFSELTWCVVGQYGTAEGRRFLAGGILTAAREGLVTHVKRATDNATRLDQ